MLIDTHCHLDASEFDADRDDIVSAAQGAGVRYIVIPAVNRGNFDSVARLAAMRTGLGYALGIHPMCVDQATDHDLQVLHDQVRAARSDPHFLAIGEIGLDHFVPGLDRERQERFFVEQLRIAREFDLPVLLHVRRAQDQVLKHLRRLGIRQGIAHAFNGSLHQAQEFWKLGLVLGFGGAMTWPRALQIRRLAQGVPSEAYVLETDAPDIPPHWCAGERNAPTQLPAIATCLAELRAQPLDVVTEQSTRNTLRTLPRLAALIDSQGLH